MRRGGLALIAFLVLGGLTKLMVPESQPTPTGPQNRNAEVTGRNGTSAPESPEAKAANSPDWYPTQIREKIRDFYGEERAPELDPHEQKANSKAGGSQGEVDLGHVCESEKNWCVPKKTSTEDYRGEISFVIATTPDPVHSHLGLFFDRSIDAIQEGATSQRYLFDRAIMPWQYMDIPVNQKTKQEKILQKVRDSYPGLMIFRGGFREAPLFVFVVGETPTAGINKEQFYNAISMIHEIRNGSDTVKGYHKVDFRILGPSFSGSLYSLQKALSNYFAHYWSENPKNQIPEVPVYAVVMSTDAIEAFGRAKPPHVQLAIFMEDGKTALTELLEYTGRLGYRGSYIAVLNEDNTQYGVGSYSIQSPSYLTLSFPRGISQFRSAYSKDLQNEEQAAEPNQPQRRTLRLDLEVTGSNDDDVAPYAPAQTALSQEAIMLSIVSELRRHEIKFILIRATDPLDELFLARYLGSQYPDARLVVPTPDLLFARDEGGALDGVLGLNTYLVSPADSNPLCSQSDKILQIFPAASSTGLYNATAALLNGLSSAVNESPASTGTVKQLPAPMNSCTLSPNLWLTVVSRNNIYPLRILQPVGQKGSLFFPSGKPSPREIQKRTDPISPLWGMVCVLCLALLANHFRGIWKKETLGYWVTARLFANPEQFADGKPWIREKAYLLGLGSVTPAAMAVVLLASITPFSVGSARSGTFAMGLILGLSLLLFTALVTFDLYFGRKERIVACLFLSIAVCFAWAAIAYAYERTGTMVLWQQRTIALGSHVSSATPLLLLLAGFYALFWIGLKSESLTDWRCPRLPVADDLPDGYWRLDEFTADAIREVEHPFGGPWWIFAWAGLVVALLAVAGMAMGPGHIPIRSLEGSSFDVIYSIFFALAVLLLIVTLLRTVALWWQLQPLLMALERPGMKQAFQRLKGFEWDVIWNPLQSMRDEVRRMYLKEILVVDRLCESLGGDGNTTDRATIDSWKVDLQRISTRLRTIHGLLPEGNRAGSQESEKLVGELRSMQFGLAKMSGVLCKQQLNADWNSLPADNGTETSPGKAAADTGLKSEDKPGVGASPRLSNKSTQLAEELVACVYATFITVVLLRIRWLVFSAVAIYTVVVFSSVSYPFQPAAALRNVCLFLFLAGAVAVGYVYEAMHHDPTLMNMTSTDPNKIDSAFWLKLLSTGLLPLLGLLTSLFPQVGHFLYTIAAPILQATR